MQANVYIRMQCGSGNADGASLCGGHTVWLFPNVKCGIGR